MNLNKIDQKAGCDKPDSPVWLRYAALLFLCLTLYLPGMTTIPPIDRDEPRYAQASRQMTETGDYVQIRFMEQARNKKPIGIYWLQAGLANLTGHPEVIWPYRLASVLGSTLAVLALFSFARKFLPERTAFFGAAFLAACPLMNFVSHAAITDTVLLSTVVTAQGCLALIYFAARSGKAVPLSCVAGFWLAQSAGILVKGPIAPMVSLLTILTVSACEKNIRWTRSLRILPGLLVVFLCILPWLIAVQTATDGAFLRQALGKDFLPKLYAGQESHGGLPGLYLLMTPVMLWPIFLPVCQGLFKAKNRVADPRILRFLFAWLIPAWLVFEFAATKLPHYVLPAYPVLAVLAAIMATRPADEPVQVRSVWFRALTGIWVAVGMVLAFAPLLFSHLLDGRWSPAAFGLMAIMLAGLLTLPKLLKQRSRFYPWSVLVFSVALSVTAFGLWLPQLNAFWPTRQAADMVHRYEQQAGHPVRTLSLGYAEPSLAFMLGTKTGIEWDLDRILNELKTNPDAVVIVQAAADPIPKRFPVSDKLWQALDKGLTLKAKNCYEERFLAAAAAAGLKLRKQDVTDGYNYSKGKRVKLTLYVPEPSV
ncbi:MAG TPA: glycosyltransferase family 39 protein [Pontiellaceae bacterium]|nr:glycosyltransferase family 39 protein [Pontiellaceae bacterium]HPR82350.1 glycosyltransferase family 39 protein [Pontiellaceae bacterium]